MLVKLRRRPPGGQLQPRRPVLLRRVDPVVHSCLFAQDVGMGLGNQLGPAKLEELTRAGGFSRFRVADQTPFNLVLEVRP